MSPADEAKAFFERAQTLDSEDLREETKKLPEAVQEAFWKLRKASHFDPKNLVKSTESLSPSGKYKLVVSSFKTGPGTWNYSQGQVFAQGSDTPIATVQRNYGAFPYLFVEDHPNGHSYLICGEDYQGQTVIELDTGLRRELLKKGHGFCWGSYEWLPSMQALLVDGCFWACPYEFRFFDFSDPMSGWPQIGKDVYIDADSRKPEFLPDGTIKVFQTEYTEAEDDEDEEKEKLGPVAAFTVYRREGLKFVEVEAWISEKEQERRRRNKEAEERYNKWLVDFKATDPLYLAMKEGVKDPVFRPADYISLGITYDKWCPEFTKQERRMCHRIHTHEGKTGYTIDLEWAVETGPIKLVVFKDGKSSEDKFFSEHSVESMQAAFAYAKAVLS